MSDDPITLVIDGAAERRGNIPAEAFVRKLREFITLVYAFDKAFSGRSKRAVSLELVDLRKSSPARAAFRARAEATGYDPQALFAWTAEQLGRIYNNDNVHAAVNDSQLDAVIALSHQKSEKFPGVRLLLVEFKGNSIALDGTMEARAKSLRQARIVPEHSPWRAGVSKGSLFGELRSVSDLGGERTFVICPPTGVDQVQCVFAEHLREEMNRHLFQVVRVHGFLHYNGESPFPILMEAEKIDSVTESGHFSDLAGIFKDREYDVAGDGDWLT